MDLTGFFKDTLAVPAGSEIKHGTVVRIADSWAEIRTWGFSNTKSGSVNFYTSVFHKKA